MKKLLPVIGSQRSGTTLMGQMLGAHPQAILIDENDGLYNWMDTVFSAGQLVMGSEESMLVYNKAGTKYQMPEHRISEYGVLADTVTTLVLKAPNLTYHFSDLARLQPGGEVVCMLRDIRDVVASMLNLKKIPMLENQLRWLMKTPEVAEKYAAEIEYLEEADIGKHQKLAWIAKLKMGMSAEFENAGMRVHYVRYEEFVTRPREICFALLRQLGLPLAEECLSHELIYHGMAPGKTQRSRPIDKNSLGKWRETLSVREEKDIWEIVEDFMLLHGYSR